MGYTIDDYSILSKSKEIHRIENDEVRIYSVDICMPIIRNNDTFYIITLLPRGTYVNSSVRNAVTYRIMRCFEDNNCEIIKPLLRELKLKSVINN